MNIQMIEAAAQRLAGHAVRTPLLRAPLLDQVAGRPIWIKPECLQLTGSFKFRGAWSALTALAPKERARGVIAYSSGNHAQGIALAAQRLGCPAVIIMPSDAPKLKIDNTRALGGEVVLYDRITESREEIGASLAAERGLTLIKPYDEPQVIAGQGTIGLEMADDFRALDLSHPAVLVPCGGGGLTSGVALALASHAPGAKVHPCEPAGFDDATRSLAAGERCANATAGGSICDAIVTPMPGALTFPIMAAHCGPGLVVSDEQALKAVAQALIRLKLVVEPGGAVALAAALSDETLQTADISPKAPLVVVLSGGNADPGTLIQALH
jgi:threonine dehydratase